MMKEKKREELQVHIGNLLELHGSSFRGCLASRRARRAD